MIGGSTQSAEYFSQFPTKLFLLSELSGVSSTEKPNCAASLVWFKFIPKLEKNPSPTWAWFSDMKNFTLLSIQSLDLMSTTKMPCNLMDGNCNRHKSLELALWTCETWT